MAPRRLTTKAEYSRIAGVSKASISKAVNCALQDAVVAGMIDINHPASLEYLAKKGVDPTGMTTPEPKPKRGPKPKPKPVKKEVPARVAPRSPQAAGPEAREAKKRFEAGVTTPRDELPDNIPDLFETPFGDLVDKFWYHTELKGWLEQIKLARDIEKTELMNRKTKGETIDRTLVQRGMLDPINAVWIKMLRDGAKTMAKSLVAKVLAGDRDSVRELEQIIEDDIRRSIGKFISMAKSSCEKAVKECNVEIPS